MQYCQFCFILNSLTIMLCQTLRHIIITSVLHHADITADNFGSSFDGAAAPPTKLLGEQVIRTAAPVSPFSSVKLIGPTPYSQN